MALVDHLLATRTPLELAKELAKTALENAQLKERVARLECELFWSKTPTDKATAARYLKDGPTK